MSDEEVPVVCRLCGSPIAKVKGQPEKGHKEELEQQLHHRCNKRHSEILLRHNVRQEDYNSALFQGMTQILHLENTEAIRSFQERVEEATKEAHEEFPYLAATQQAQPQATSVEHAPKPETEKVKVRAKAQKAKGQ